MRQRLHARTGMHLNTDTYGLIKQKCSQTPELLPLYLYTFFFVCVFLGGDVDYSVVTDLARFRSKGVVKQE